MVQATLSLYAKAGERVGVSVGVPVGFIVALSSSKVSSSGNQSQTRLAAAPETDGVEHLGYSTL